MAEQTLLGAYDYRLVVLSVLIAILASYTALDLGGRVTSSRGWARLAWLVGGGTSMGIGIWSMHYIGMLAFSLPIPIEYDWPTVLLSLLAGVFAALVALFVVSRRKMGWPRALAGSIFMGGAIVALHYIAMYAMRVAAMCHFSPLLVTLSVLLAISGSWVALWLTFFFRDETRGRWNRKIASALLMGTAIVSMHYSAMAAASFTSSAIPPDLSHAVSISTLGIAGISGVPVMVLVITLVTSTVDRLQEQKTLLDELFEQAPDAVVLVNGNDRVVRINRAFTRIFGYAPQEALGRRLRDLIICSESRDQGYWDLVRRGQRVDTEDVCRRKDGSQLDVAVILLPFSLPRGGALVYAIYRDITERKRADDELRELTAQLLQSQEEERRRLARELHDSTGQKLAALAINLSIVSQSAAVADARAQRALADSLALTHECVRDIRTLTYLLHPPELEELGLADAARDYINGFSQRSGISVDVELSPDLGRLPREVETALFRILQESLNNVLRHSGSPRARVHIYRSPAGVTPASVTMEVQDEGQGMQEGALKHGSGTPAITGVGVVGMRERVRQLGGELEIHSTPNGTTLKAVLPLNQG
jgi:PAS domain S-box-containing protein